MHEPTAVAIIGAGAMGTALARAFSHAGVPVAAIASRSADHAESAARAIEGARAVPIAQGGASAPIVLLTVSDSAIEAVCEAINAAPGTLVAHVSGSRDASALETARKRGAVVGSFHPLAAVARGPVRRAETAEEFAAIFRGAAFAIEGDSDVQSRLFALATALGGHPFAIEARDKPLYHLGASMLAAFSAGLADVAWELMHARGAPDAVASAGVAHLLQTVASNIGCVPRPAAAQTGPVARGDVDGVRRQAATAGGLPAAAHALYRAHIEHNIEMARQSGRIDAATAAAMIGALDEKKSN